MSGCDYRICDFCSFYRFNGDSRGVYLGLGECAHPAHPHRSEPCDGCADFSCAICAPGVIPAVAPEGEQT